MWGTKITYLSGEHMNCTLNAISKPSSSNDLLLLNSSLTLENFPLLQHIIYQNKLLGITKKEMSCGKAISKIDVCKDELNNPQCQYSNGHCCGEAILHFCTDCECKDPRNTQMRGT